MKTLIECGLDGCRNEATHTWSGYPRCDEHTFIERLKTPIEKAAEELWYELGSPDPKFVNYLSSADAAAIIRRVLGEEVPKRDEDAEAANHGAAPMGYNDCRRDIGLEDL